MALPQPTAPVAAEDYLRREAESLGKHEYFHDEALAKGGASRRHVTISGNVATAVQDALDGTPCRAYMADMNVQAAACEAYFYPDVMVTCESRLLELDAETQANVCGSGLARESSRS